MSPLVSTAAMTGTQFRQESRDGNPVGLALYRRHFSRHGREPALFVVPGEKTVLLSHEDDALLVWRRFIDASGQQGVNCAVFRNGSPHLALAMILNAETSATERRPGDRLYTYVSARRIRSADPGYYFKWIGWYRFGMTRGGLVVLAKESAVRDARSILPVAHVRVENRGDAPARGDVIAHQPLDDLNQSLDHQVEVASGLGSRPALLGVVVPVDGLLRRGEKLADVVHTGHAGTLSGPTSIPPAARDPGHAVADFVLAVLA